MITTILIALASQATSANPSSPTRVEGLEVILPRTLAREAGSALGDGNHLRSSIGDSGYGAERKARPFAAIVRGQLPTDVPACDQLVEYSRREPRQVMDEPARSASDSSSRASDTAPDTLPGFRRSFVPHCQQATASSPALRFTWRGTDQHQGRGRVPCAVQGTG